MSLALPASMRIFSDVVRQNPNTATVLAALTRGFVGDSIAQTQSGEPGFDPKRCATYMLWTTGVAFAIDRYVYSHLFKMWFPVTVNGRRSWANAAKANATDNFFISPILYMPTFYCFKDVVMDGRPGGVPGALGHYRQNAPEQLAACWAFWLPAHMLTFSAPAHLRTVLVSAVGTGYVVVLSAVSHYLDGAREAKAPAVEEVVAAPAEPLPAPKQRVAHAPLHRRTSSA